MSNIMGSETDRMGHEENRRMVSVLICVHYTFQPGRHESRPCRDRPVNVALLEEGPGLPVSEGNGRLVGVRAGPVQTAAGKSRKTGGHRKDAVSRESPLLSRNQDSATAGGGGYASWDLDSLLQALKPTKEVKRGRMNARNLYAGALSSSKGREKEGPNAIWFQLGLRYNARNEHDNAIAAFTAAIAADPRDGSSYYNRAVIRQKCGQYEAAIDDYTRAARLAPSDADIYYNRGLAYQCLGNPLAAIADYSRAIRLNPADAEAYWNRGLAFSRQGKEDLASTDYCSFRDLAPDGRKQEGDRENTPIRSSYQ